MPKCPYCKKDLIIEDFFEVSTKVTRKGKIKAKVKGFRGEKRSKGWGGYKMWSCPACDNILGFSEYKYSSAT